MTKSNAIAAARRKARKIDEPVFVVHEDEFGYGGYDVATSYDLETFYIGAYTELVVTPDGYVYAEH